MNMRFFFGVCAISALVLISVSDDNVSAKGKPAGVGQQKGGQQKGGAQQAQQMQHGSQQAQFHQLVNQLQHAFRQGNPAQIQAAQQALQVFLAQAQLQNMNQAQQGKGKGKGKG